MKYIVFKDPNENEHLVMFSPELTHHAVNAAMSTCPTHCLEPVSAGFVRVSGNGVSCWGESGSMKLKSRGADDEVLVEAAFRVD
jgi:hypothetical protein